MHQSNLRPALRISLTPTSDVLLYRYEKSTIAARRTNMPIFSSKEQPVPRRKSKPKPNPWDRDADFTALKAAIANGKMKPQEQVWMYIDAYGTAKKYGLKFPARTAADSMRRFIKSLGLESDYYAEKYETNQPGQWILAVTYDPPTTIKKGQ
jgi:hypothetical protein